jgi:flavodoxin
LYKIYNFKEVFVMDIAVRYCSKTKFGNTRRIAEAIADGVGVKAGDASAFVENYSRM